MKILLVEDDTLFCELISSALHKHGFETSLAFDGDDAIVKLRDDDFDLMITDIFMPNKEGIEVIQEVKDTKPHMKIIAISSGGQAGYTSFLKMAETFGADATLQKPFSPAELIATITLVTE